MTTVDWSKRSYSPETFRREFEFSSDWEDLANRLGLSTSSSSTKSYIDRAAKDLGLDPGRLGKIQNKYTDEELREAVKESKSIAEVLRRLGIKVAGGNHAHISKKIRRMGINTSHFTGKGSNRGKTSPNRKSSKDILIMGDPTDNRVNAVRLRRALREEGVTDKCNSCGLGPVWNNKPLTLEVNHVNGNFWDNRLENLEFLCPNCHSQEAETNRPHKYRDIA